MKALTILVLTVLFMSTLVVAQVDTGLDVTRTLPAEVSAGDKVTVELSFDYEGEKPSGLVVEEKIPDGWTVVDSAGGVASEGKISWLLYGGDFSKSKGISYVIEAPEEFGGDIAILGFAETTLSKEVIEGDSVLMVSSGGMSGFVWVIGAVILAVVAWFVLKGKKGKK